MTTDLEQRLIRAGRVLDAACEEYISQAASQADSDRTYTPARGRSRRRAQLAVSLAVAGAVAVILGGVRLLADGGRESHVETPADAPHTPPVKPLATVAVTTPVQAAVEATRAAPSMAVEFSRRPASGNLTEVWNYSAPDRWELLDPGAQEQPGENPPAGTSVRLYVGEESWSVEDGRWVPDPPGHRKTRAPQTLFDALHQLDCHQWLDGAVIAWESSTAPCSAALDTPEGMPPGAELWIVWFDDEGRFWQTNSYTKVDPDDYDPAEYATLGDADTPDDVLPGAVLAAKARFWYEGVAEVGDKPAD